MMEKKQQLKLDISKLILPNNIGNSYEIEGGNDMLQHLSKVNIFVGSTNSGKSRFLRTLFCMEEYEYIPKGHRNHGIGISPTSKLATSGYRRDKELKEEIETALRKKGNILGKNKFAFVDKIDSRMRDHKDSGDSMHQHIMGELKIIKNTTIEYINQFPSVTGDFTLEKVYIPTLRGLRGMRDGEDIYDHRTRRDYFTTEGGSFSDKLKTNEELFTGQKLYNDLNSQLLGYDEQRKNIESFQDFLSKSFFNGQKVTLIPLEKSDVIHIKVDGLEKDRAIYDVGDGIQALVMLLYPIFSRRDQYSFFFIEEPELYMHPGLQRKFIDIIKKFSKHIFFFTTHSNHILDMTLDVEQKRISIYKFSRSENSTDENPKYYITNTEPKDLSILKELGVYSSSVFLSNCSIWVEGIHDRRQLRHTLHLYQKYLEKKGKPVYKEDIHYSFAEYGGANLVHFYSENNTEDNNEPNISLRDLCGEVFVVCDNLTEKEGRKGIKPLLKRELGNEGFHMLEVLEIENLISPEVLIRLLDKFETQGLNERQKAVLRRYDYSKEYLGKYLIQKLKLKRKYCPPKMGTGTLTGGWKEKFAIHFVEEAKDFTDLSKEGQKLAKKMYKFIASRNP